jgi:hypothetical protein
MTGKWWNELRKGGASPSFRSARLESLEPRLLFAADVVLEWNEILLDAVRADATPPPRASRAMAIVHTAVYDAVNSIDRSHQPFAVQELTAPSASREAAAAAAAHRALEALFPLQDFDDELTASLAAIADGAAKDAGIALGESIADQILALRAADGSTDVIPYTPGTEPGDWRPTPPAFAPALLPHWANVTPFAITTADQFMPNNIPALDSAEYAAAFAEVKEIGSVTSATRTQDQTDIALFWANGAGTATPPGHLNVMAQVVSEAEGLSLSQNARLFALLNVSLADAAIMCWETKFTTDFWRPVTAIRAADTDGNDATEADPLWTPLVVTPPFPSYSSGHSSFSGAAAAVLTDFFGTDAVEFTLPSEHPLVADRHYTSFSQAAQESADSRLYGGIHWRFDNEDGLSSGIELGQFVSSMILQPVVQQSASAQLSAGVLLVFGSDSDDYLRFVVQKKQLVVYNGAAKLGTFSLAAIEEIEVAAGAGNDIVMLGASIRIAATIYGGDGDDLIHGTAMADRIFGEGGSDLLYGLAGDDWLDGGDGDDTLYGGAGIDYLLGGTGKNRLVQ